MVKNLVKNSARNSLEKNVKMFLDGSSPAFPALPPMDLAKIHLRSGSVLAEGLFPEGLINVSHGHMRPTWKLTWRVWLDPIWPCRVLSRLVLRALASSWRVGLSCEYFGPSWRKGRVDFPALLGQKGARPPFQGEARPRV